MLIEEHVTSDEVVEIIRRLLARKFEQADLVNQAWRSTYCGYCGFIIDGYEMWIFNNCNSVSHIDDVVAPDKRIGNLYVWSEKEEDAPHKILSKIELYELEKLLSKIR